ncbi:cyclohexadienyl dehydratase [Synergistales bacterium]|nr:cyclohexadienyl dehydratase [Synergistales bacterium]
MRVKSRLVLAIFIVCVLALQDAEAGDRLNRILESKVLRVGTPGDYRPLAMLEDGKYEGFDVDVIALIAKELGVKVEFVPTSWPKLMEDHKADKFDISLGGITRNVARMVVADFLPPCAPFGKVALIRAEDKGKFTTPESLNQPDVRVIKNPGGTNEKYVDANLTKAKVTVHENNAEIPGLIAEGKGDVMITDTYEALVYSKKDNRLAVAFVEHPLTPLAFKGYMLQNDDPDYVRVMKFVWGEIQLRGELKAAEDKWLK